MGKQNIIRLHNKHIRGTQKGSVVVEKIVKVCRLSSKVNQTGLFESSDVYINTKALKHLYDKRTAQEFDLIINELVKIIKFPEKIYQNINEKRGSIGFVKTINEIKYFCSIEKVSDEDSSFEKAERSFVVTCFRIRKETYLENCTLLWSWKGGVPSS